MVLRKFIDIDNAKCNGCGNCVVTCAEGALKIENGKAVVVKEQFCDGLGACIGDCPQDALKIIEKDVAAFDEHAVEAHLEQLKAAPKVTKHTSVACGCPGSAMQHFAPVSACASTPGEVPSRLAQWPVQLHLVSPSAPYFQNAHLLVAADCVAFSYGNFHQDFMKDKAVVIACPKLDDTDPYIAKLADIINEGHIEEITIARMQVPCCGGLTYLVKQAVQRAAHPVVVNEVIIGIKGEVLSN